MASVICEKYTMTIITLNKERFLHRKGSSLPPQFHLAQASPLQSEFPTWVRGLFSLPPLGHWRGALGAAVLPAPPPVSGAHPKYFPKRSTAGPTPHIWSSGHSCCYPPSSWDCPKRCPAPMPAPSPKKEIGIPGQSGRWKPTWENVRKIHSSFYTAAQTLGGLGGRRHSHCLGAKARPGRRGERAKWWG